jgi:hypothetical protein
MMQWLISVYTRSMTIEQWAKFLQPDHEWVKPLTMDDVQSDRTRLDVYLHQLISKRVIHLKPCVHLSLDGVAFDDVELMQTVARMPNVKVLSLNMPPEERYTDIFMGLFEEDQGFIARSGSPHHLRLENFQRHLRSGVQ